jgi:hypothetical protein
VTFLLNTVVRLRGLMRGDSLSKVIRKMAPRPDFESAHKRPPCDSIIERLMGSPNAGTLSLGRKECVEDLVRMFWL